MDAKQAQEYISKLERRYPPKQEDLDAIEHLKVNYKSLSEMPEHTQSKIRYALDYIIEKYDPPYIDLVRSYVDGYPIDETTSIEDFNLIKKVKPTAKFSDFDFIVPTIESFQKIEQIAPLIKIDLFKVHHNNVRTLRLYTKL